MATKVWTVQSSGDWFTGTGWNANGTLTSPPTTGDTADIQGSVTITAADAATTGQGTLDGISIGFEQLAGSAAPVFDVTNEEFGAALLLSTPFGADSGKFIARGTVSFAGTLDALANPLTLDIEANGGLATFTNTGTVEATQGGSLAVTGTANAAFVNNGQLVANGGTVSVQTAVTNGVSDTLGAYGFGTLTDSAALTNHGLLVASQLVGTAYAPGTITLTGALDNTGTLEALPFGSIAASGGVANSGRIVLQQSAVLSLGGGVDNSGSIDAGGGSLAVTGDLTNEATATFDIQGFAQASVFGNVTNDGALLVTVVNSRIASPGTLTVGGTLTNAGNLLVDLGGVLSATSEVANSGTLSLQQGSATLNGLGNTGMIATTGTLSLGGSADNTNLILVQAGTVTDGGTLTNEAAGTLQVTGSGAMLTGAGALVNKGLMTISQLNGNSYTGGAVSLSGSLTNAGSIAMVAFGTLGATGGVTNAGTISNGGGSATLGGSVTNTASGDIAVSAGSLGFTGTVTNSGTIATSQGTTTQPAGALSFGGDVLNTGTIADTAGTVTVTGSLTGAGTILVGDHVTLDGAVGAGQVIDFGTATDATLDLGNVGAFQGTIANLNGHDIVHIDGTVTGATYDAATHLLTVLNGTSAVAAFTVSSGATTLYAGSDPAGGSVISTETIGSASQVAQYIAANDWVTLNPTLTPQAHNWPTPDPTLYYSFDSAGTLTAAAETAFVQAMSLYSDIANINFATSDATHAADLVITTNSGGSADTSYTVTNDATGTTTIAVASAATISIDTTVPGWKDLSSFGTADATGAGGYGFLTVLHELGHAVGFGHPGPYNDGNQGVNFLSKQIFYTDSRQYTVMSYIDSSQTGANWNVTSNGTNVEVVPQTPMMYDIAAAQSIYGVNTAAIAGGSTFGFKSSFAANSALNVYNFTVNTTPVVTIYDAGQNNTLDLSGFSTASYVNLNSGDFSSADGLTNNIGIAGNTTINSAVGGAGNDVFTLNALADTIDGGLGVNTVVLNGPSADYTVTGHAGTITVTDTANSVADTLTNVQMLQFSDMTAAAPCFMRGTMILTARGDVPVQALRAGEDRVVTRDGRLAPVAWVGWRTFEATRHPHPADVMPVRVRAGAIAPGRPRRDLLLSPDHALALDGVLIPVRYLVNGTTIVQEAWSGRIAYYHVELDRHDVLLAEGVAAESYLDTGNRAAFANGAAALQLHPRFAPAAAAALRIWAENACAPLVAGGPVLETARAALAARARALGHVETGDPALRLTVQGRALALRQEVDVFHAVLPVRAATARLLTRSWAPLDAGDPGADPRRLGVAVAGVWLDGTRLALDDARLGTGWHAPESGFRWTDGAAEIGVRGARRLSVRVVTTGRYWLAPAEVGMRASG